MIHAFELEFKWSRCWRCGKYYAVEKFGTLSFNCPFCQYEEIKTAEKKIESLEKSIRSLKAYVRSKSKREKANPRNR